MRSDICEWGYKTCSLIVYYWPTVSIAVTMCAAEIQKLMFEFSGGFFGFCHLALHVVATTNTCVYMYVHASTCTHTL
jgi:hypothetical protein